MQFKSIVLTLAAVAVAQANNLSNETNGTNHSNTTSSVPTGAAVRASGMGAGLLGAGVVAGVALLI